MSPKKNAAFAGNLFYAAAFSARSRLRCRAGQDIAQHYRDRTLFQGSGQRQVIIRQALQIFPHRRRGIFYIVQRAEAMGRAVVRLGKEHIKTDNSRLCQGDLVQQLGNTLAGPRPLSEFFQAVGININNNNPRFRGQRGRGMPKKEVKGLEAEFMEQGRIILGENDKKKREKNPCDRERVDPASFSGMSKHQRYEGIMATGSSFYRFQGES